MPADGPWKHRSSAHTGICGSPTEFAGATGSSASCQHSHRNPIVVPLTPLRPGRTVPERHRRAPAMLRPFGLTLAIVAVMASAYTDVHACGDKFLRVGRSARFRRYASVHPSAILLYAPQWTGHGVNDFEEILRRAGHRPLTVTTASALADALKTSAYQVIITSYGDAPRVKSALRDANAPSAVLPVIYKAPRAEEQEAAAAYTCLLRPEKMTQFDALEMIDRLLDSQKKPQTAAR